MNLRKVQFSQLLLSTQFVSRSGSVKLIRDGPRSYGRAPETGLSVEDGDWGCGEGAGRNSLMVRFGNREEFVRCSMKLKPV